MKKSILTLCTLFCCLMTQADNAKSLFVTFMDGQKIEFALADFPEVTFGDDLMKVKTSKTNVSYELWTVKTFTYATATGIKQVKDSKSFSIEGNSIIIDGTGNNLRCYKMNGEKIALPFNISSGKTTVNLDALKHGVYLIELNGKVIKIARQ